MLRTDYALYLYRPNVAEESKLGNPSGNIDETLSKTLTMQIGGIAGLGSSEAKSVISLEKHRFAPGEKIKVMIDCDNTQCKKPVKSYKIKLMRKISCLSGKKGVGKPLLTNEEYIVALKYDGCLEKVRDQRTIEFDIPLTDKAFGTVDNLHPELRHMVKMFTDSSENSLYKIEYCVDIFVKHQSKLEFGMGNSVNFPIEIKSESSDLAWVASKEQTWMMAQDISQWMPTKVGSMVELRHSKDANGALIPETVSMGPGNVAQVIEKAKPVAAPVM